MSAGHIDWHEWDGTDVKVCVILDDASRMVLAGGEFAEINTENSKLIIDQLVFRFQNNIATFNTLYCNLISCHLLVSAPP
jgi:hypothetical protein